MGWKEFFLGAKEAGVLPEADADLQATLIAGPTDEERAAADQLAADHARLKADAEQRIAGDAEAFAAQLIADHKAYPAEQAALAAVYLQAATDDLRDGGQRLAAVRRLTDARPAHRLTEELVPQTQDAAVLLNTLETATGAASDATRRTALLNMTPMGQRAAHLKQEG